MNDLHISQAFNRYIEKKYLEFGSDLSIETLRKQRDAGDRFDAELVERLDRLEPSKVHTHRWVDGQTFIIAQDTCIHYYSESIRPEDWGDRLFVRTSMNGREKWSSWREAHSLERTAIYETLPIF